MRRVTGEVSDKFLELGVVVKGLTAVQSAMVVERIIDDYDATKSMDQTILRSRAFVSSIKRAKREAASPKWR